jgi:PPM family protein phosphatase
MNVTCFTEAKTGGTNEDALEYSEHPQDNGVGIVALADGQGGRSGGAEAAQTAVKSAVQMALSAPVRQLQSERFWTQLLLNVDKAVGDDPDAGFTTFVGVAVTEQQIVGVSSGDSQAVLISQTGSSVMLTANQRKNPPVGSQMCHPVPFSAPFAACSRLLLMSDGVYKFVPSEMIVSTVAQLSEQDAIQAIRMAAVGKSGTLYDDFSLVVIGNTKDT